MLCLLCSTQPRCARPGIALPALFRCAWQQPSSASLRCATHRFACFGLLSHADLNSATQGIEGLSYACFGLRGLAPHGYASTRYASPGLACFAALGSATLCIVTHGFACFGLFGLRSVRHRFAPHRSACFGLLGNAERRSATLGCACFALRCWAELGTASLSTACLVLHCWLRRALPDCALPAQFASTSNVPFPVPAEVFDSGLPAPMPTCQPARASRLQTSSAVKTLASH